MYSTPNLLTYSDFVGFTMVQGLGWGRNPPASRFGKEIALKRPCFPNPGSMAFLMDGETGAARCKPLPEGGTVKKMLADSYGRVLDYLRLSVTDRCNLRCLYCMGPGGIKQIPHREILTYEEILQVVRVAAAMGMHIVRITGGEPLVRKGLPGLVEGIARIPGITDLAMTTNGILLSRYAVELKAAGLKRVNISLDSLQPDRYAAITRGGNLERVLDGIETALALGLEPVKLNTVLLRGFNDSEVPAFLRLAREQPLHVRFIEYMPIGDHDREYKKHYLPLNYVQKAAEKAGLPLSPAASPEGTGPAQCFTFPGGKGSIGLIHPISRHFCSGCNRLRLTAEGKFKPCLYWPHEFSVRPALGNPEKLRELLLEVTRSKPQRHLMGEQDRGEPIARDCMRAMSRTGG